MLTPQCGRCGIPVEDPDKELIPVEWIMGRSPDKDLFEENDQAPTEISTLTRVSTTIAMCHKCARMCTQFIRNKPNAFLITTDPTGNTVESVHLLQDCELPIPTISGFDEEEHISPKQMKAIISHSIEQPCISCMKTIAELGGDSNERQELDSGD